MLLVHVLGNTGFGQWGPIPIKVGVVSNTLRCIYKKISTKIRWQCINLLLLFGARGQFEHKKCHSSQYKHEAFIRGSQPQYIHPLTECVHVLCCFVPPNPTVWLGIHKDVPVTIRYHSKLQIWWTAGEFSVFLRSLHIAESIECVDMRPRRLCGWGVGDEGRKPYHCINIMSNGKVVGVAWLRGGSEHELVSRQRSLGNKTQVPFKHFD